MIKVTADIFSGRQNPEWVVTGDEAEAALRGLAQRPAAAAALESGFQGLGNRGLIVEFLEDHTSSQYGLPSTFRVAGGGSGEESHAREAAERLVAAMTKQGAEDHPTLASEARGYPLDENLKAMILQGLPAYASSLSTQAAEEHTPVAEAAEARSIAVCWIETGRFNPGFWNDPAHIGRNNCYNYASNRRTDTFAQPGRATGHQTGVMACPNVTAAALSDGLHHRFDCFPDSEKPRWLMAR